MLKSVCAWCKKELGVVGNSNPSDQQITHGICRNCTDTFMAGSGRSLDEFLDSMPQPILLVGKDFRIVTANAAGRKAVSKNLAQIKGHSGGEVFGCSYENLPGGCGESIHCQSCEIRNLVKKTFETGIPSVRIPACQDLDTVVGPRRIRFLISVEYAGNAVLLRIDDAQPEDSPDSG